MRSLLCDDLLEHEMTAAAMLSPHKMVQWTVGLTIREVLICDLRPQVGGIPCPCSFSFFLFPLFPLLVPSSLIPFLPLFFNSLCLKMLALICLMISILQTHFSLRSMGTQ